MRTIIFIIVVLLAVQRGIRSQSTTDAQHKLTQETTTATATTSHNTNSNEQIKTSHSQTNTNSEQNTKHSTKNDDTITSTSTSTTEKLQIPDKKTLVKVEQSLLSLFGMKNRPKPIDRSKVVIPDAMKALYAEIMGMELRESVNLPKPGLLTQSANTARSFFHEGLSHFLQFFFFFAQIFLIIFKKTFYKNLI